MSTGTDNTASSLRGLFEFWKHNILRPSRRSGNFELRNDGVYYHEPEKNADPENPAEHPQKRHAVKICSWLEVAALSRDDQSSAWGKVLRWKDFDGNVHQWSAPAGLLVKNGTDLLETLAREGLDIVTGKNALVKQYIQTVRPNARLLNVGKTGWYNLPRNGRRVFVLPEQVIGNPRGGEGVVYQPSSYTSAHSPIRKGSLEEWQKHVSASCMGNTLLTFAVSTAFAAPLLEFLGERSGGGFHLRGESSKGKTTALSVASSVWGHPISTWRTTDNALEDTAERHHDMLLPLDELSQVDPKKALETIYMLGNGQGKDRSSPTGEAQRKKEWRLLFLSTGEISLVDHVEAVGGKPRAGTEMRMVELDADAGAGKGIFQFIHGFDKPSDFADYLTKDVCLKYRGTAGPVWAAYLIEKEHSVRKELEAMIAGFTAKVVPPDSGGEVHRTAQRFALVGSAGELATSAGITGWEPGMAWWSAQECFQRWLSKRSIGSSDVEKAIRHLRGFLQTYGDSRFDVIDRTNQFERLSCRDRAGFRKPSEKDGTEYLIFPEAFEREIAPYCDPKRVAQELRERKHLRTESGRLKVQQRIPGMETVRFYAVQSSIFAEEEALTQPL